MAFCTACGHELGVVRFCTHCGSPVAADGDDIATDTAERPAIPATPPPGTTMTYATPWAPNERRGRTVWPVFVAVGVVLVLIMVVGIWLLGGRDDEPESASPTPADKPADKPADSTSKPSLSPSEPVLAPADTAELARTASASVPVTAPPGQDVRGNKVPYTAGNMLDGVPSTAWRMPGDGTGQTLTFTLEAESVLTEVGLINGYAKIDRAGEGPTVNWYLRNRRVTEVEWGFDDGTTVKQALVQSDRMQTLPIQPEETTNVTLTLLSVSAPGARNGRDFTPVSDVTLVGG